MSGNVTHIGNWKKGDAALIVALAKGLTARSAATEAGLSERTVYRRLQDPAFRQAVDAARSQLVSETLGRLISSGVSAAATLQALLKARSEHVRLGSARAILELTQRYREADELERRITALEQALVEQPTAFPGRSTA
jgi:type II secretory pathway component PulF